METFEGEGPVQVTDWSASDELKPIGNVALVVLDVADDRFESSGLSTRPSATGMPSRGDRASRAEQMVDAFRAKGLPVVFVQDVNTPSLVDAGGRRDDGGGHGSEGRDGEGVPSGLDPLPHEYLIRRRRHSAFFGSDLDLVLKGYLAQTLVLIGGRTDVSAHYTAVDAHQLDYRFRAVADLAIGSDDEMHEAALRAMKYLQRDALVSSSAVYTWLDSLPSPAPSVAASKETA